MKLYKEFVKVELLTRKLNKKVIFFVASIFFLVIILTMYFFASKILKSKGYSSPFLSNAAKKYFSLGENSMADRLYRIQGLMFQESKMRCSVVSFIVL